jgi:hypothetical protein
MRWGVRGTLVFAVLLVLFGVLLANILIIRT